MSGVIVGWPQADLVKRIATVLQLPVVQMSIGIFADSELYVELINENQVENKTVIYVSQIGWPLNDGDVDYSMNDYLLGVFQSLHLIKQLGAEKIIAVIPYLPYIRQEKGFREKHLGVLSLWAAVFKCVGVTSLLSCDIHASDCIICMNGLLHEIPFSSFWVQHIQQVHRESVWADNQICLVSPDHGGIPRVQAIAKILNCPIAVIKKERVAVDSATALTMTGDVSGKLAILVDDILDTAHTASNACKMLKSHGAVGVVGCFTHAVLSLGACNRVCDAGFDKILVTDTLAKFGHKSCLALEVVSANDFIAHKLNAFYSEKRVDGDG